MTDAQRKAYKAGNRERALSLKARLQIEGKRAYARADVARREINTFRYNRALREWRLLVGLTT